MKHSFFGYLLILGGVVGLIEMLISRGNRAFASTGDGFTASAQSFDLPLAAVFVCIAFAGIALLSGTRKKER